MPYPRYDFAGKTVLVMGLGRFGGGVDAAEFALKAGAKVIITDSATEHQLRDSINKLKKFSNIKFHLGSHDPDDFEKADIVVANPAVPGNNIYLEIARRSGRFVTSGINIFFELCPAQIIGITGANGKSTTTAMTAHLLQSKRDERRKTRDENVWLGGNIGNKPLLTILDKIKSTDLVVLELSSFQIEQLAEFESAPDVALLTNLTPNHLDRYGTFENYCAAKENIFQYQKPDKNLPAVSIFNAEDKIAVEWFEKYKNDKGRLCIKFSADDVTDEIRDCFKLPGRANLSNLAAALAIVRQFGADDDSIKNSLSGFKALPHRLELVEEINDVSWYNDSKATTPEGAITALEAFSKPVIIIAGGYDKNLPFDGFGQKIAEKAKAAILLGQTAPKIADAIKNAHMSLRGVAATEQSRRGSNLKTQATSDQRGVAATEQGEVDGPSTSLHSVAATQSNIVDSLAKAVALADRLAESGDVVLLSPACASYDMFENYEQRGLEFIKLVRSLIG